MIKAPVGSVSESLRVYGVDGELPGSDELVRRHGEGKESTT